MIKRVRSWWRRRRSRKAAEKGAELREFIYLDEVSVTSLLASVLGAIPAEITESLNESLTAELNNGIELGAMGMKSNIGSRIESTRGQSYQILRKATIQATFKDLYENQRDRLVTRSFSGPRTPPVPEEVVSAIHAPADSSSDWLVTQEAMPRGAMLELDVELQADPVFRVSSVLAIFDELFSQSSTLGSEVNTGPLRAATEMNELMRRLMAGLVPLKSQLLDYVCVQTGHSEYLLSRSALAALSQEDRPVVKPTYLVGVAESNLFWKDIRRVLFSRSRVKVLCRMNADGLQRKWAPVKLTQVLDEVAPGVAAQIDRMGVGALEAMALSQSESATQNQGHVNAFVFFGDLVADKSGHLLSEADRSEILRIAQSEAAESSSISDRRVGYRAIIDYMAQESGITLDSATLSGLRTGAEVQAGIDPRVAGLRSEAVGPVGTDGSVDARFLDVEIVAIYW